MHINRMKLYYICLCFFFVLGGFGTAYLNGEQVKGYPDMSQNTPQKLVGDLNNYINQKVNPSTMGDILITEYLEHPQEATGVVPLFPTQSVVQEMDYINTTITDMTLEIIPGEDPVYGTTVGISVFTQTGASGKWKLQSYEIKSTAGVETSSISISIELKRINFDEKGGSIKIVITNFGTEISDLVYIPTINIIKDNIRFSGINTDVDTEKSLFLTVMNKFRDVRGYRYFLEYKKYVGLILHQIGHERDQQGHIIQTSDEVVALFEYPSLLRLDSEFCRYSNFVSPLAKMFPSVEIVILEELFRPIPILNMLVNFKHDTLIQSHATVLEVPKTTLENYLDGLVSRSQNSLNHAAQPAIATLLMTKEVNFHEYEDKIELMNYFKDKIELMNYFKTTLNPYQLAIFNSSYLKRYLHEFNQIIEIGILLVVNIMSKNLNIDTVRQKVISEITRKDFQRLPLTFSKKRLTELLKLESHDSHI